MSLVEQYRMCESKHQYTSQEAARKAKIRMQKSAAKKKRTAPVRTYACPYCYGWHLTSKPLGEA